MNDAPPGSIALERMGIPHTVLRHAGQVNSLEQAAQERGQRAGQVVRSIVFRVGEDAYLMALVAGPAQISWKRLRQYLGQSRLTMATEEDVLAVTGYRVGAVSPFGLKRALRLLVDTGILAEEQISLGSGIRSVAIIMASADLVRSIQDAELVKLVDSK